LIIKLQSLFQMMLTVWNYRSKAGKQTL